MKIRSRVYIKQDCLSVEGRPCTRELLWPWPWLDDPDIRNWPRYYEDVHAYERWTLGQGFQKLEHYRQTDRRDRTHYHNAFAGFDILNRSGVDRICTVTIAVPIRGPCCRFKIMSIRLSVYRAFLAWGSYWLLLSTSWFHM